MIKCSICSYQCDNWYASNWRLACHLNVWMGGFWSWACPDYPKCDPGIAQSQVLHTLWGNSSSPLWHWKQHCVVSDYIGGDALTPRPFADKRRLVPHAKASRMHLSKQQWNSQVSALAGLRGLDLFSTTAEGEEVHLLCHQPWSISPSSATQTPPSPRRWLCGPSRVQPWPHHLHVPVRPNLEEMCWEAVHTFSCQESWAIPCLGSQSTPLMGWEDMLMGFFGDHPIKKITMALRKDDTHKIGRCTKFFVLFTMGGVVRPQAWRKLKGVAHEGVVGVTYGSAQAESIRQWLSLRKGQ